jgi:hypothetical protein
MKRSIWSTSVLATLLSGCVGQIGGDPEPEVSQETASEVGISGMRRLSIAEVRATVRDLTGFDPPTAESLLPGDDLAPFDNDYTRQQASEALIKGAELLAGDVADAVVSDPTLRAGVVGCEPSGPDDLACFRSFLESFGRKALRRPLSSAEVDRFATLLDYSVETSDFWLGVNAAMRALLQHPEFLYRVEIGEPVAGSPGLRKLGDHEIGARLSYFLLGTTPPDFLLDAADAGELTDPAGLAAAAEQLWDDDRARLRMARFHAMWLGYSQLSADGISGMMHSETSALLDRVIFDEPSAWTDVLLATETFLTPELAEHYGLALPDGEAGWVSYGESGRKGLLSHGTFLSVGAKFGDTSPTQRGLLVRARMFCQPIGKPPPNLNVNVDMPPQVEDPNACKEDRYFMTEDESCKGCHSLMDPIGFGLEAFGPNGQFREAEPNKPECEIDGVGTFDGDPFVGPAGLADLAVESGLVEACVAKQLYRFAVGRFDLDEHDEVLIKRVVADATTEEGLELGAFVKAYITSEAFRYRRDEVTQ